MPSRKGANLPEATFALTPTTRLIYSQKARSASAHTDTSDAPSRYNALVADAAVDVERTCIPVSAIKIERSIYRRLVVSVAGK
jgi:hypothetical protein